MSLQLVANHLAQKGRGPDSTLVHMTPGEVASLQALAQQHGGSLSINPQTGLPEAGFLSALLPMAAGAGLAAMGMPAGYAALSVGAASAATNGGDMKKAILNGFSAYTGAGLADSFMGAGAAATMGTSTTAAPATTLATPPGATSPYALTGSSVTPSTTGYSLGEPSSYLNKSLPSLVSAAPAEVAQAAAAATPAAQQAAALQSMDMGQRFDALKAGASGTNAMNYIKANPFASLGTATAMLTPDENKTPQKAADTDRGPRSKLQYYSGYGTSLPAPNMQGVEQTYNRPYYAAKGGVTRMATGGITSAPRNQQQLFADYLQRVSSSGVAATPPTNKYEWWKNQNDPAPATPPAETPEQYAARMSLNARGGGGGRGEREPEDPNSFSAQWAAMDDAEKETWRAENPKSAIAQDVVGLFASPFKFAYDKLQAYMGPKSSTGGPARYRAPPVVPNENDEPGDRYAPAYSPTLNPSSLDPSQQAKALAGYTSAQFNGATNNVRYQYDGKEISAAEAKALVDQGKYPTVVSDATSANEAAARIAPVQTETPYGPAEAARDEAARDPANWNDAPVSAAEREASQQTVDSVGKSNRAAEFGGQSTGFTDGSYTTSVSLPFYAAGDESKLAGDIKDGTVKSGDSVSFDGKQYKVSESDGAIRLTQEGIQGPPALSLPAPASTAVAQTDAALAGSSYNLGPFTNSNLNDSPFNLGPFNAANTAATTAATTARLNAIREAAIKDDAANQLMNRDVDTFAPVSYSVADEADRMFAAPDIVGINEISADPNADKKTETLGIPSAETFAAMIGSPFAQTAALNTGVVSDAGVSGDPALAGYQGGYNPGYATPNMGYGQGRGAFGIGGVWTNKEGIPIRTGDGSPLMTGEGAAAMQRAVAESNAAANRTYGNSINSGPANDGRADPGGEGGTSYGRVAPGYTGGSEAADGGLSTPYGFQHMANGGLSAMANPYDLGSYSDGGRLLRGPGDGVSDSIPATIGKGRPARLADGEFVIPARIVSEIGNGSTDAGARKLYAMMDRIQAGRKKSVGKGKVAVNSRAYKHLPT